MTPIKSLEKYCYYEGGKFFTDTAKLAQAWLDYSPEKSSEFPDVHRKTKDRLENWLNEVQNMSPAGHVFQRSLLDIGEEIKLESMFSKIRVKGASNMVDAFVIPEDIAYMAIPFIMGDIGLGKLIQIEIVRELMRLRSELTLVLQAANIPTEMKLQLKQLTARKGCDTAYITANNLLGSVCSNIENPLIGTGLAGRATSAIYKVLLGGRKKTTIGWCRDFFEPRLKGDKEDLRNVYLRALDHHLDTQYREAIYNAEKLTAVELINWSEHHQCAMDETSFYECIHAALEKVKLEFDLPSIKKSVLDLHQLNPDIDGLVRATHQTLFELMELSEAV